MRCLLIIGLFVLAVHRVESDAENSVDKCKPGSNWKEDCNLCHCLDSGVGVCTHLPCNAGVEKYSVEEIPELKIPTGVDCLPGTSWKSECNYCLCLGDGYPACTNKNCPSTETEPRRVCAPNTIWKDGCAICRCRANGYPACSWIACDNPLDRPFDL